ncbi:MAG: beta-ketoacyl-ACP synthase II [Clostridium sp.]|nr:beta-ketoacyl-ACP synthase II [Clostridium sp.]
MKRRVVVTGLGAITPLGKDVNSFWDGVKAGKCGIDFITLLDTSNHKVKVAGEVKDFKVEDYMDRREAKKHDRYSQFAMVAADEAMKDSGIDLDEIDKDRFGVLVSSGIGGLGTIEKEYKKMIEKDTIKVSPYLIPMMIENMAGGNIAIKYGAKGPCLTVVTACATGTNSIGEAFEMIKADRADVIITGGSESSMTEVGIAGFNALTALSISEDPKKASLPFDKNRGGFVLGEGAGVLILEELNHALSRKAKIYGEVVGYGTTCDAYHMTQPDYEGPSKAMEIAIKEAKITSEEVSYINAHGTGTLFNDKTETKAIKKVFGNHAYNIPVSSTKSMTGHMLGAAGAVEGIVCLKALQEGIIPPTIGLENPDEECDLDYVPNKLREGNLKYAMSNSLGFGGHNGTLLFKKWEE